MIPIVRKIFSDLFRERTIVFIIGILLFVTISMGLVLSTATLIFNPQLLSKTPMAVGVVNVTLRATSFETTQYASYEKALQAFDEHKIDAVVYQTGISEDGLAQVTLTVPSDPVKSAVATSVIKQSLLDYDLLLRQEQDQSLPIVRTRFMAQGSKILFETLMSFIIPFLILIPLFFMGNLLIDIISEEYEKKTINYLFLARGNFFVWLEHALAGWFLGIVLCAFFLVALKITLPFLQNIFIIFMYSSLIGFLLCVLSILAVALFRKKDICQTVYSFSLLTLFLLTPFLPLGPVFIITDLLLGNSAPGLVPSSLMILGLIGIVLAFLKIKR